MGDPGLSQRISELVNSGKSRFLDTRQQQVKTAKAVTADQFSTIFEDTPDKNPSLQELKKQKLKSVLDEARTQGQVYDREREQILLRFPKHFSSKMEDMLTQMQDEYAGVMQAQQEIEKNRLQRINLTLQELESEIQSTHKCKNPKILESLAAGMLSAFAYNADQIIELLVDDLVEEQIVLMNGLEEMRDEKQKAAELAVQKNRIKKKLAESEALHAWKIIEVLEQYKDELGY